MAFHKNISTIIPDEYQRANPYPHFVINNILDASFATQCQEEIMSMAKDKWDRYNNVFEQKYTLRDKTNLPPNCSKLFDILTSDKTLQQLSTIVGEPVYNDTTRNWWGIHVFENGDYLDMHSDAGNHPITKQKKHITLGIYLTSKEWSEENGGHLEVWDGDNVMNDAAQLTTCINKILPSFNKMIMFTNTVNAWHGSPEPCITHDSNIKRIFLTLSYVSDVHVGKMTNSREKAFFVSRPGDSPNSEKDKLRLLRANPATCKQVYNSLD
jgi:Rps23 Pro-64 3,4-dihydroxylase Tpa1-like proline 4-hydroxylase